MKCVVTDYVEKDLDWEREQYEAAGVAFEPLQLRGAGAGRLLEHVSDADVLVVDQARITPEVIAGLRKCTLIIRHGDGFDNLDVAAATDAGILCANKPGFWSVNVAEQTVLLALSLIRKLPAQLAVAAAPRDGENSGWDLSPAMPMRLAGSLTAGVVGYGKIGEVVASMFSVLFDRVLVSDPGVTPGEKLSGANVVGASHEELYRSADLVSLHVPANEKTTRMIDAAVLALMKPGGFLVNTARGAVVDSDALANAVQSGRLAGAALDVTSPEPLPTDHPLRACDNVMVTPHLGWYAEDALWNMRRSIVADVLGARDGTAPASVLNRELLSSPACRLTSR